MLTCFDVRVNEQSGKRSNKKGGVDNIPHRLRDTTNLRIGTRNQ
jgi:hypothetical protein